MYINLFVYAENNIYHHNQRYHAWALGLSDHEYLCHFNVWLLIPQFCLVGKNHHGIPSALESRR